MEAKYMFRIVIAVFLCVMAVVPLLAHGETIKLEEVVISASRYEEAVSSVPAHVSVITEKEIQNSTAQTIPDVLRTEAGVHVNDIAGNRHNVTVDVRGFGETAALNTLVLVDGRRVNQADLSGTDWTQIPLDRVEKIEIIRGGRGGVLFGDNASGGVINIVTKEGEDFKAGAGASAGSYDMYKGNAYVSGTGDNLSFSLSGSYLSSDGYRDNADTEAEDLGLNVNYYLNDLLKFSISSGYHKDKTGLPGALRESDFSSGASRTDTVNPKDFADVEDYYVKGGPEVYFLDESLVRIDVSFRKRGFSTFASFAGGEFTGDTEIDTFTISPQVLLKNNVSSMANTLTLGIDYQDVDEEIVNDSLFFGIRTIGEFKLEKENYGYYFHDEMKITDDLLISGGYRYDRAKFSFQPSTPEITTLDEEAFTGGINYTFYDKSYVYVGYSRSFRYPVLDELFSFFTNTIDSGLVPQRSDDYEIGIRHYVSDASYVQANVFRIDTDEEIFFNPLTFVNENLEDTSRRDGAEISFNTRILEWLSFNGSYTFIKAEFKGGMFEGNEVPNIPNHKVTLGTEISPGKGFLVVLNGVYIGERPFISDFANDFEDQENYIVVNGKIKYTWKNLTAFLDVNNVFNEEYSEYGVLGTFPLEKAFFPSPKRNYLAGVSMEF
jgi:iron complex outermembrane receptor protein